ncbi:hypothetical protein MRX96_016477 [Rhipicephalus microplus]
MAKCSLSSITHPLTAPPFCSHQFQAASSTTFSFFSPSPLGCSRLAPSLCRKEAGAAYEMLLPLRATSPPPHPLHHRAKRVARVGLPSRKASRSRGWEQVNLHNASVPSAAANGSPVAPTLAVVLVSPSRRMCFLKLARYPRFAQHAAATGLFSYLPALPSYQGVFSPAFVPPRRHRSESLLPQCPSQVYPSPFFFAFA